MGIGHADRWVVGPVRWNRRRLSARTQGRYPASRRTGPESIDRQRHDAAKDSGRRRTYRPHDRGCARYFTGRHAAIQRSCVQRLHHRLGRTEFAYCHRCAQPRHSGRRRHVQRLDTDYAGRLAHHRRRCRCRDRWSVAERAGTIPRAASAFAARPQETRQAQEDAGNYTRRHGNHLACQYRIPGRLRGGNGGRRQRRWLVPLRVPVHGACWLRQQVAIRRRTIRVLSQSGSRHERPPGNNTHARYRRRQAARYGGADCT